MQKKSNNNADIKNMIANQQRANIVSFMQRNSLSISVLCKKAGIREATLRHFLSGRNKSITTVSLELLAIAINVTPCEIMWSRGL